jgi:hypothetical protein
MMNVLVKFFERIERWAPRLLGPPVRGAIHATAWVLRRGRYRPWRREQARRAANSKSRGPGASGWE